MTRTVSLVLTEWQTVWPDAADPLGRKLVGLSLSGDPAARDLAEKLAEGVMLEVQELATGLRVHTTSWVGRVELGPLHLDIRPKIPSPALLALLRYAYGLRDLRLESCLGAATNRACDEPRKDLRSPRDVKYRDLWQNPWHVLGSCVITFSSMSRACLISRLVQR
ncbi:MAG TPA: hypothetical protein GXX40_06525 [Firmicutes bacterium]|nr:hypothetical protein [Bacillota bacterium]